MSEDLTSQTITNEIIASLTSKEELNLTETTLQFKYVKFDYGGAYATDTIQKRDNYCFIYAMYLGYKRYFGEGEKDGKGFSKEYWKIKETFRKANRTHYNCYKEAIEWMKEIAPEVVANIEENEGFSPSAVDLLEQLGEKLGVSIRIRKASFDVSKITNRQKSKTKKDLETLNSFYKLVYPMDVENKPFNTDAVYIDLLLESNEDGTSHYHYIRNLKTLLGQANSGIQKQSICRNCEMLYNNARGCLNCKLFCNVCLTHHEVEEGVEPTLECKECLWKFYNQECFNNHLKKNAKGESLCSTRRLCKDCKCVVRENHKCGHTYCAVCSTKMSHFIIHTTEHNCFIRAIDKVKEKQTKFIFLILRQYR